MTSCPRCEGPLELQRSGILRDAHGVFVPESQLRQRSSYQALALLRASLQSGEATLMPCPSCRAPLVEATLQGPPRLTVDGCARCNGFWFDKGELDALRRAMLGRSHEKPRTLGGYGGSSVARGSAASPAVESAYATLTSLGAFLG